MKKAAWPYLVAVTAFAILIALLFARILLLQSVPGSPDSVTPMALSKALDALYIRTGSYPLWQPWTFSGMPTVGAFSYLSGLYLPNLLFGLLRLDGMHIQLLHLVLAGMGGFVLMKRLGVQNIAAFLTGAAFMLNPFMTAMLVYGHGSQLMTAAWMPWALWAALRLSDRWTLSDAGLLALVLGVQLQRAHVQIAYYTWMLVVTLLVFRFIFDRSATDRNPWKALILGLVALTLGVAAALQIYLPALDYLPFSARSGAGDPAQAYQYATMWSMHPMELLTYLLPGAFGFGGVTYWGFMPFTDFPHYSGLIVLGFAVAGLVAGRKKTVVIYFAGATLFALLLSFGNFFPPLYNLFYHFAPLFSSFRVPSMALIIVALSLAVLSGFGLQAFIDRPLRDSSSLLRWGAVALALGALLYLAFVGGLEQLLRAQFPPIRFENTDLTFMVGNIRWGLWRGSLFILIFIAAVVTGILWLAGRGMISTRVASLLLVVLSAVDLLWIDTQVVAPGERSLRQSPLVDRAVLAGALEEDEVTGFLSKQPGPFRIYPAGALFTENKFSVSGVESTGGYHAAKLGAYQDLLARTSDLSNLDVLRMLNVQYIVSPLPINHPDLSLVKTGSLKLVSGPVPVAIYRLSGAMPRAWLAPVVTPVGSDAGAVEAVMGGHGAQGAVFAADVPWQGARQFSGGSILSLDRTAESISVKVRADGEAFLVLSEVWYPKGWKLKIDGQDRRAVKVDGVLRGVVVPSGTHTVRFDYDRSRFDIGRAISLVAILLSLIMVAGGFLNRPKESRTEKKPLS